VHQIGLLEHVCLGQVAEVHAAAPEHVDAARLDPREQQLIQDLPRDGQVGQQKVKPPSHLSLLAGSPHPAQRCNGLHEASSFPLRIDICGRQLTSAQCIPFYRIYASVA
jgi:hypothetical protein